MDHHEWAAHAAPPPDAASGAAHADRRDGRPSVGSGSDARDPSRGGWSGPITGSGREIARYGDHDYWDGRYANRDDSGRGGSLRYRTPDDGYHTDRPALPPATRPTAPTWQAGNLTHTGSIPVPPAPAEPPLLGTFDDDRDYPMVLTWTGIWYAVPVLIFLGWGVTREGDPKAICAGAQGCTSARGDAMRLLLHAGLGIVVALLVSLAVATLIRRWSMSWRAITLGFAASVIGAGLTTLAFSLM